MKKMNKPDNYDTLYDGFVHRNKLNTKIVETLRKSEYSCMFSQITTLVPRVFGEVWYDKTIEMWCCNVFIDFVHYETIISKTAEDLVNDVRENYKEL